MSVAVLAPRDVPTTLNYNAGTTDGLPPTIYATENRSNIKAESYPVLIHDVRGKEATVGLDVTGFEFAHYPSAEKDFEDEERIKHEYYPEVEAILKNYVKDAKRVHIFDHTIRRSPGDPTSTPKEAAANARGPVLRVHVDQTFKAGLDRVSYHLPDEADRLLKGRVRIINVWRPIRNTVAHNPLAVADYRSIDPKEDLITTKFIYPHRSGETFGVRYRPTHNWHYLSDQTPDEITLIKCFDSDVSATARLTPHSAFKDGSSPASAPHRQSIEVRALVFDLE